MPRRRPENVAPFAEAVREGIRRGHTAEEVAAGLAAAGVAVSSRTVGQRMRQERELILSPPVNTDDEKRLIAETRCAPAAVRNYLQGGHVNASTRTLLDRACGRLGLPTVHETVPEHAACDQCRAAARRARGLERRDDYSQTGDGRCRL